MSGQYERQEKSLRKHPVKSSSTSRHGTTPSSVITRRPEWKGPSFVKPKGSTKPTKISAAPSSSTAKELEENVLAYQIPIELQQLLLNIFKDTFQITSDPENKNSLLRNKKRAVSEKNLAGDFEDYEKVEGYAAKWNLGRMLCFANILAELWDVICPKSSELKDSPYRVISLGGGAAEVVAFGGLLSFLHPYMHKIKNVASPPEHQAFMSPGELHSTDSRPSKPLHLHLIDSESRQPIIDGLTQGLYTPPLLSKYASASAKAANHALLAPNVNERPLHTSFQQSNILALEQTEMQNTFRGGAVLITLFFTLNELFNVSHVKTTAILLELTNAVAQGSVLLVIDYPDSYFETAKRSQRTVSDSINKGNKEKYSSGAIAPQGLEDQPLPRKYPMVWFLDHILLRSSRPSRLGEDDIRKSDHNKDDQTDVETIKWEKVIGNEARWFRPDHKLRYPVELADIQFQMHVYRRV